MVVLAQSVARSMATVLNQRGFITHDDFGICNDNDFGRYVCSQEDLLRGEGYRGGPLEAWSSGFRLSLAFTYGVLDSESPPPIDLLDAYTLATGSALEQCGLVANDLKRLLIGLQYQCSCGELTNVDPNTIPFRQRSQPLNLVAARCCKCGNSIESPAGTYNLFMGVP